MVEFAPPGGKDGKGKSTSSTLSGSSQQSLSLPPSQQQQQQQQRRDSSASQQGRVTFVFPAQYLVTVAPAVKEPPRARVPVAAEGGTKVVLTGMTSESDAPRSTPMEEVVVA